MEQFEQLRAAAILHNREGEFPSWLLSDVIEIADHPELYADKAHLIELLQAQIEEFDSYAGAGCFNASIGPGTIRATVGQIRFG